MADTEDDDTPNCAAFESFRKSEPHYKCPGGVAMRFSPRQIGGAIALVISMGVPGITALVTQARDKQESKDAVANVTQKVAEDHTVLVATTAIVNDTNTKIGRIEEAVTWIKDDMKQQRREAKRP